MDGHSRQPWILSQLVSGNCAQARMKKPLLPKTTTSANISTCSWYISVRQRCLWHSLAIECTKKGIKGHACYKHGKDSVRYSACMEYDTDRMNKYFELKTLCMELLPNSKYLLLSVTALNIIITACQEHTYEHAWAHTQTYIAKL